MWKSVKRSLSLLYPNDRRIIWIFGIIRSLLGILDLFGIFLMGLLLAKTASQATQSQSTKSSFLNFEIFGLNKIELTQLAVLALSMFLAKSILSTLFMKLMASRLAKAESMVSKEVFARLVKADPNLVGTMTRSNISFALTYSAGYAISNSITVAVTIFSEAFLLIGITVAFAFVNLTVTIMMALYFLLIGLVIQRVVGSQFQKAGKMYADSAIDSSLTVESVLETFKEISTFQKQNYFVAKYEIARSRLSKSTATIGYLSSLPRYIVESALMIGAVALAAVSFRSNNFSEAASTLGIFLTGGLRIMASMLPLQNALGTLKQQTAQGQSFIDLHAEFNKFELIDQVELTEFSKRSSQGIGVGIEITDLDYKYPKSNSLVINKLNMHIEPGSFVAIIGPSGSGKSTLADLILGLTSPVSGTIKRSKNFKSKTPFAYVPQTPGMIHGSIRENIALGLAPDQINLRALDSAIKKSHLERVLENLEDGIDSKIDAYNNSLSGGQLQRIGLARALYFEPELLVLDEATSALDAESESVISTTIGELMGKCTVVVIAHRLTTVQNADVVFVLDQGQIVASGTFSELIATNEMVARYVELSEINTEANQLI